LGENSVDEVDELRFQFTRFFSQKTREMMEEQF
jgi:hypothetical protein